MNKSLTYLHARLIVYLFNILFIYNITILTGWRRFGATTRFRPSSFANYISSKIGQNQQYTTQNQQLHFLAFRDSGKPSNVSQYTQMRTKSSGLDWNREVRVNKTLPVLCHPFVEILIIIGTPAFKLERPHYCHC